MEKDNNFLKLFYCSSSYVLHSLVCACVFVCVHAFIHMRERKKNRDLEKEAKIYREGGEEGEVTILHVKNSS